MSAVPPKPPPEITPGIRTPAASRKADRFWEQYQHYNGALRGWLLAFGAAILAFFVTNPTAFAQLKLGQKKWVLSIVFAGILLQVLSAFLNKHYNLACYHAAQSPSKPSRADALFRWLGRHEERDLILDLISCSLFAGATIYLVFTLK